MAIILYNLMRETQKELRRPVSSQELFEKAFSRFRMGSEEAFTQIKSLEQMGLVSRTFDYSRGMDVWKVNEPELTSEQMLIKYPAVFEQTLFGEESMNGISRQAKKKNK